MLLSVALKRVGVLLHPLPVLEERGVHIFRGVEALAPVVLLRLCVLLLERLVGYGVEQAGTVYSYRRFEAYADLVHAQVYRLAVPACLYRNIVGAGGNGDFGIYEFVTLSVRELVAPFVHIGPPVYRDLLLVERSLEGRDGPGLGHAGERGEIGSCLLVVQHQQVAVSHFVVTVGGGALSVAVAGVAHQAGSPQVEGTQTVERFCARVEVVLEDHLSVLELLHEAGIFHGGGGILERRGRYVECRSEQSSGIGLLLEPFGRNVGGLRPYGILVA